ncbi:MAG: ABC transporter substrate-binding protein [Acidimicrobiales bacterium]
MVRAACAVAIAGLVATACSSSGGKGNGSGASSASTTTPAALTPKPGGKVVMGVEAEIDGFLPTANRFDVTGLTYATTVFDPLATYGSDNKVHPYLAESITPNADYTVWTIKLRPNITFSNGDPLTNADVVADLQAHQKSSLTGPAITNIQSVAPGPDNLTVIVTTKTPWVPFPVYLTGQVGMVFSPKMLTDPQGSQHPIGTGPFILKEWVPGNHFIATKNPNYWQKGLPYLDSVEYRPIVESTSRDSSLAAGTVDVIHSSDPQTTVDLKGNNSVNMITDAGAVGEVEEVFIMLNTGKAPLDDVTLRQALAYATDRKKVVATIDFGLEADSNGPFGNPGSAFHGPTGYPDFDLAKAKALVAQYEQKHGVTSVPTFELGTTNSGRNLQEVSLLQQMWADAGIKVTIKQVEQSQFILYALQGNYNAYLWRQFGEPDPDGDYVWWSSATAAPEGALSLNFARNKNPKIDADLQTGRTSADTATRKAAYQDIATQFGTDVPYVWLNEALWQIAAKKSVHGILDWTLPDGSKGVDHTIGGFFLMSHVWQG